MADSSCQRRCKSIFSVTNWLERCACVMLLISWFAVPIHFRGSLVWTREDALASIVAVEMVDLPSAQFDSEGFLSLLDSSTNPFMQAIKRWKLQASLFQDTIRDVIDRGIASLIQPVSTEELLRDKFNMRKLIVSVTAYNKVIVKCVFESNIPQLNNS